jgi:hypothetical protein
VQRMREMEAELAKEEGDGLELAVGIDLIRSLHRADSLPIQPSINQSAVAVEIDQTLLQAQTS